MPIYSKEPIDNNTQKNRVDATHNIDDGFDKKSKVTAESILEHDQEGKIIDHSSDQTDQGETSKQKKNSLEGKDIDPDQKKREALKNVLDKIEEKQDTLRKIESGRIEGLTEESISDLFKTKLLEERPAEEIKDIK
jgi:hypothetical protein